MNNFESPSSPEEKWAAYMDRKFSAQEAAAFERENPGARTAHWGPRGPAM